MKQEIDDNYKYYCLTFDVIDHLYSKGKTEEALSLGMEAAWFCRYNYSGFYVDSRLENFLLEVGNKIEILNNGVNTKKAENKKLKILHVATEIYDTGGHTREFQTWIDFDTGNQHDIVLTNHNHSSIPDFFKQTIEKVDGTIYKFNNSHSFSERVSFLRNIADQYNLIALHLHPNDVIPVVAFAKGISTPVAFQNHSDWLFWVGSSITDYLLELRGSMMEVNKVRRQIEKASVLPIVISKPEGLSREEARRMMKVNAGEIVILAIANNFKITPLENKNFFEDIIPVLNKNEKVRLYIIGVAASSEFGKKYSHPKITYVGLTKDTETYKYACDIYVDCYPVTSMRAVLEAGLWMVPVLRMYTPASYSYYNLDGYTYPLYYPKNRAEWQNMLNTYINDAEQRKEDARKVYVNMVEHHTGDNWLKYLQAFYKETLTIKHSVHPMTSNKNMYTLAEEDMLEVLRNNVHKNIYLVRFLGNISFKLKLKVLFNSRSFNLHSAKLFVYYLLGIKEKTAQ